MTPEEKSAEKLRLQKIQEEADLRVAMETFGVTDSDLVRGELDGAQPTNPEELSSFKVALVKKISQFKSIEGFPGFIEELVQGVCLNCMYCAIYIRIVRCTEFYTTITFHSQ